MADIQKSLEILIVEDGEFDSGFSDALVYYSKKWKEENPEYVEKIRKEKFKEIEKYESFPIRLTASLKERGYHISNIEVKREWNEEDNLLLSKYDIILSDLSFPTDFQLTLNGIEELVRSKRTELETTYEILSKNIGDNVGPTPIIGRIIGRVPFKPSEDSGKLYGEMAKNSENRGFIPLGLKAKENGKKITFYTNDLGHTRETLPLGIITGLIMPYQVEDVTNGFGGLDPMFRASKDGRLLVGAKSMRDIQYSGFEKSVNAFENWIKALETAIKYQTG